MNLTFPLCREPRHETAIREALGLCVRFLTERVSESALRAVVLTGSFARGEGSVLRQDGGLKVLGDFEFFVVLDPTLAVRSLRQRFAAWGREASARLARSRVRAEVEFGPVESGFFGTRARPSIFVYDLRNHGKVLWGDPDILAGIPAFPPEQIPRQDALFLLFNRTIEQLEAYDRVAQLAGDPLLDIAYQRVKLALDLAGSALAFAGSHAPLYHRRPAAFARLVAETPSLSASLPPDFAEEVREAARAKTDPAEGLAWPPATASLAVEREILRRRMVAAVPALAGILRWELEQLVGGAPTLSELLDRYTRESGRGGRLRDWARVVLHPMPAPLPIAHAKIARLLLRGTPRALLYAAGARAYLGLGRDGDDESEREELARHLPVPRGALPADAAGRRRAIVALWTWCIRNN